MFVVCINTHIGRRATNTNEKGDVSGSESVPDRAMSAICLIDLKSNEMTYPEADELAKRFACYGMMHNVGVAFNCGEYGQKLVKSIKSDLYVTISDSFLHRSCGMIEGFDEKELDGSKQSQTAFYNRFKFIEDLLFIILHYKISEADIYLSCDENTDPKEYYMTEAQYGKVIYEIYKVITANPGKKSDKIPPMCIKVKNTHEELWNK